MRALLMKAWRESRARFLSTGAVLGVYCLVFLQRARLDFPPSIAPLMSYSTFVWRGIYSGPSMPVFVVIAFVLGLGGLHRERAGGTHAFTLALPVSRARIVGVRALVGMAEAAGLALIPMALVPWLSPIYAGHPYAFDDSLRFAVTFACVGVFWTAVGVVTSTVCRGEYSGIAASVAVPSLYVTAMNARPLRQVPQLNVLNVMNGAHMPQFDPTVSLYVGSLPWTALVSTAVMALGLIAVAMHITQQEDF